MSPKKRTPQAGPNPPAAKGPTLLPEHQRASKDRMYEAMMRGGGEPFGAPFTAGLASLMDRVVARIKQRGFFGFETMERAEPQQTRALNKFTRYGAAPFRGELKAKGKDAKR